MQVSGQGVLDPKLVRRELYNREKFSVIIEVDPVMGAYVMGCRVQFTFDNGLTTATLQPGHWLIVPHGYFIVHGPEGMKKGEPINLLENFGKHIGKGFKNPSLPVTDVQWERKGRK